MNCAEMSINVVTGDRLLATSVTNITDGGEKIIRHVTRDIKEADIFYQGSTKQLQWADVFKCIVAGIKEEKIRVRREADDISIKRDNQRTHSLSNSLFSLLMHV